MRFHTISPKYKIKDLEQLQKRFPNEMLPEKYKDRLSLFGYAKSQSEMKCPVSEEKLYYAYSEHGRMDKYVDALLQLSMSQYYCCIDLKLNQYHRNDLYIWMYRVLVGDMILRDGWHHVQEIVLVLDDDGHWICRNNFLRFWQEEEPEKLYTELVNRWCLVIPVGMVCGLYIRGDDRMSGGFLYDLPDNFGLNYVFHKDASMFYRSSISPPGKVPAILEIKDKDAQYWCNTWSCDFKYARYLKRLFRKHWKVAYKNDKRILRLHSCIF